MTFVAYVDHVQRALCWVCHKPTHKSHAAQRQCPQCRCKWSYGRRGTELALTNSFVTGFTAAQASRQCGIAYRTAWTHFLRFENAARRAECTLPLQRLSEDRKARIQPPYPLEAALRELLYTRLVKPFVPMPSSKNTDRHTSFAFLDSWLRGGLFYITTPGGLRAILRTGLIKANHSDFPSPDSPRSVRDYSRSGAVLLCDAKRVPQRQRQWLTFHTPVTVAIKLNRRALRRRVFSAAEPGEGFTRPALPHEICHNGQIPLRAVRGFAFISAADCAIHRIVAMTPFSQLTAIEIVLAEFERTVV